MRRSFLLPQRAGSRDNVAKCTASGAISEYRFGFVEGFTTLLLLLLFLVMAWGLVSDKLSIAYVYW